MDSKAGASAASIRPEQTAAELAVALGRIEARLGRLEELVERVANVSKAAPALTAMAVDAVDDWANRHGDLDVRLRTLSELVERLTRPEALAPLMTFVDLSEQIKPAIATFTDIVDDAMARAATDGMQIERLAESTKTTLLRLAQIATGREVRALFESGMLDPAAVATLGLAARAVADASAEPPRRVGVLGALGAASRPSVQRALGFLVTFAENLGARLDSAPKLLLKGDGTSEPERNP